MVNVINALRLQLPTELFGRSLVRFIVKDLPLDAHKIGTSDNYQYCYIEIGFITEKVFRASR